MRPDIESVFPHDLQVQGALRTDEVIERRRGEHLPAPVRHQPGLRAGQAAAPIARTGTWLAGWPTRPGRGRAGVLQQPTELRIHLAQPGDPLTRRGRGGNDVREALARRASPPTPKTAPPPPTPAPAPGAP